MLDRSCRVQSAWSEALIRISILQCFLQVVAFFTIGELSFYPKDLMEFIRPFEENVEKIIETAWESQRSEAPGTMKVKILHDAHVLEGGRTYLIVKTFITGSLRPAGADVSGDTEIYERSCSGSKQVLSERNHSSL